MTKQTDILNDSKYLPVLDHGFVGLVEHMGSDSAIVSAARVSYGDGTKTVNEDRGLIRYLVRHKHTSPIEMAEVKLHLRMPIFVMRQWVRHRTASLNEYSGRYSIMTDEMYLPEGEVLQPQSQTNKQGREGEFDADTISGLREFIQFGNETSYRVYEAMVKPHAEWQDDRDVILDPYTDDPEFAMLPEGFPGLARETARGNLNLNTYTELYWKQDLHNLLHLIKLRRDRHAQWEIRQFAEAVYQLIKPLFPLTIEAWEDYVWNAKTLSRMEIEVLSALVESADLGEHLRNLVAHQGGEKAFADKYGLSLREFREFRGTWGLAA